jgi:chromosome segregation ATPase
MGPVSAGTINELHGLAAVVQLIMADGGASIISNIKEQMDEVVARGGEVALRESKIEAAIEEADRLTAKANAADKKAETNKANAAKMLAEAKLAREAVEAEKQRLVIAGQEFDARVTETSIALAEREFKIETREAALVEAEAALGALKADYEGKLLALRSITG